MKKFAVLAIGCLLFFACVNASYAVTIIDPPTWADLSINITATGSYDLYLATTTDNSDGFLLGGDGDFLTVDFYDIPGLDISTQYYLNVVSTLPGGGECLLAEVHIGPDVILTDTANWAVSAVGFGVNMVTPTTYGTNGDPDDPTRPFFTEIAPDASYIWTASHTDETVYLTCALPTSSDPAIPEPMTIILFSSGLAGVAFSTRKSKRTA